MCPECGQATLVIEEVVQSATHVGRVSVNNLEMVKSSVGKQGMVYVFTGEGKGKTSAALWTAVRAAKTGMRVVVIMWYKEARWPTVDQRLGKL